MTKDAADLAYEADMAPYIFLVLDRWLGSRADAIARAHGCRYYQITEGGGRRRSWFSGPNRGDPFDSSLAACVRVDLRDEGLILPAD